MRNRGFAGSSTSSALLVLGRLTRVCDDVEIRAFGRLGFAGSSTSALLNLGRFRSVLDDVTILAFGRVLGFCFGRWILACELETISGWGRSACRRWKFN